MKHLNTTVVNVYYQNGFTKLHIGKLARVNNKIFFEYDLEFIKTGIELSPFKLPLKVGVIKPDEHIFEGLFGVFNDSLPDGWGRLLLDRKLIKSGINPLDVSPLDRLCYVGSDGMGALTYEPEYNKIIFPTYDNLSMLDEIAKHILQFQKDDDTFIDELLALNGSSAGARPKYLVRLIDNTSNKLKLSKYDDWIIKFRSPNDPKDIGPMEYAYHLIASAANIDVPPAKLFSSKNGPGYFGVKRFDRIADLKIHMHSLSGLLHIDHRTPSLDYETIMKATWWLTKDIRECEKLFRRAVFNVYMHNRDDHAKNFSYLLSKDNKWNLSPAYDLTFSSGPFGEHCTTIMGEGKNPELPHLLHLAKIANIGRDTALKIIDEIKYAKSKWTDIAKDVGVSRSSITLITKVLG